MIYVVRINDKEYEVEVERGKANIIRTTTVETTPPPANVPAPAVLSTETAPVSPTANVNVAEGEPIKAPMPGTVLDIKVSVGSSVKEGDVIMILEAMKMENEITSPVNGVVKQVLVQKGTSVETNDVMLVIG